MIYIRIAKWKMVALLGARQINSQLEHSDKGGGESDLGVLRAIVYPIGSNLVQLQTIWANRFNAFIMIVIYLQFSIILSIVYLQISKDYALFVSQLGRNISWCTALFARLHGGVLKNSSLIQFIHINILLSVYLFNLK